LTAREPATALDDISAIMLLIAVGSGWVFCAFLALVEATLTSLVVWHAWRWPRSPTA
jgi:hypothetical protein